MADDASFNPPLGYVPIPTIRLDAPALAAELVDQLTTFDLEDLEPIEVHGATAMRQGEPWAALVWAEAGDRRWIMSEATARLVGDQLGRLSPKLTALFTAAADEALRLAAGH